MRDPKGERSKNRRERRGKALRETRKSRRQKSSSGETRTRRGAGGERSEERADVPREGVRPRRVRGGAECAVGVGVVWNGRADP